MRWFLYVSIHCWLNDLTLKGLHYMYIRIYWLKWSDLASLLQSEDCLPSRYCGHDSAWSKPPCITPGRSQGCLSQKSVTLVWSEFGIASFVREPHSQLAHTQPRLTKPDMLLSLRITMSQFQWKVLQKTLDGTGLDRFYLYAYLTWSNWVLSRNGLEYVCILQGIFLSSHVGRFSWSSAPGDGAKTFLTQRIFPSPSTSGRWQRANLRQSIRYQTSEAKKSLKLRRSSVRWVCTSYM